MEEIRLFIATPCYMQVSPRYTLSAIRTAETLRGYGIPYTWTIGHDADISRRRNVEIARFMAAQPECSHLMMIDADLGWQPESVIRLLASKHEVCCGVYPRKDDPLKKMRFPFNPIYLDEQGTVECCTRTGFISIGDAPAGFLLIARTAVEKLIAAYPEQKGTLAEELRYGPEENFSYDLFVRGMFQGQYITEDYGFSRLWRAIGGKIWADPEAVFQHEGMHCWEGSLESVMVREEVAVG